MKAKVYYTEKVAYEFEIEVDSIDNAYATFWDEASKGNIDFNDGEVYETSFDAEEIIE